jgi:SOS-response transcriptional repressor LexA
MAPRLPSGALVVARPIDGTTTLRVGDVVVARRPDRPSVTMIKRIQSLQADGAAFLVSDNPSTPGATDSQIFGAVPRDLLLARVRWRYWPLPPARL